MDRIWDDLHLNNRLSLSTQPIDEFYTHPVWLMNGVFTTLDPASVGHRKAIAVYLEQRGSKRIADYGGGFGELALGIARAVPDALVSIIEPYPSKAGLDHIRQEPRIGFVPVLPVGDYDAIVAQDVLEHVDSPISLAYRIAASVRNGGIVVFANCFSPVIKCHLPSNFHLRHTFRLVMKAMGLRYMGRVSGAEHAEIFERFGPIDLRMARSAEQLSRLFGRLLNGLFSLRFRVGRLVIFQ
jgi:2-polyprenyl-6-hydroxyphenyl methylase/3-demethylubiquinone-9 3-methyltransferase